MTSSDITNIKMGIQLMWHDADQQLLFIIHPIIALGPNFYHQTFYRVFAHALYLLRRA